MGWVNIDQGTADWLSWRNGIVSATDSGVIMELNPWKTVQQLWAEKLGLIDPSPINAAMQRGMDMEPEARAAFMRETGIAVEPQCWQSDQHAWMGASLDGISTCGRYIVEIKCPGEGTHSKARAGRVPDYYYPQLQHQLAVTGCEKVFYYSYRPESKTPSV